MFSSLCILCFLFNFGVAEVFKNNDSLHFVFGESDNNCTESLRNDKLRKTESNFKHDSGLIQQVCSQVYVLRNNHYLLGFKSSILLNTLRNKRLAITGDSLGLQFFVGLFSSLCHEDHIFSAGNGIMPSHVNEAAYTHYTSYNTTIIWCKSPFLLDWQSKKWMSFCGNQVAHSDYVVLAYGARYKPFFTSPYDDASLTYSDNLEISLREFNTSLYTSRCAILKVNPSVSLIYRTHPHVGNLDEANWERCHLNASVCALKVKPDLPLHIDGKQRQSISQLDYRSEQSIRTVYTSH